jgi:general L-amino acid transport system permease protein
VSEIQTYARGEHPDLPPPLMTKGVRAWLRDNLFYSPGSSLASLLILTFVVWIVAKLLIWSVFQADFFGASFKDCTSPGACWAVATARFPQYWFGFFYPSQNYWRPALAVILLFVAVAPWLSETIKFRRQLKTFSLFYPLIALWLLYGGMGLEIVETDKWGGFVLTVIIGVVGIVASLPLGILLALGRRSQMPVIRVLCVIFIEFVRGVPLITVLFTASVLLPLFLPDGMDFDKLLRVLIMVSLFAAAYMAEIVRGGLAAIPDGQEEAARAMGLGYWQTMGFIVLPQALRIVIPGIVSSFIGLFKDTSLVAIVGLFDLLGLTQAILKETGWIGVKVEAYAFIGLIYWICCYSMSVYARRLEVKLDMGRV